MHPAKKYRLTTLSCFLGIFVQAVVSNLIAILFIPLMDLYGFSYIHLGILVGLNFTTQVVADIIFSMLIDKFPFRNFVLPADIMAGLGLLLFAASPFIFKNIFVGIVISTVIFSASSGILEIILSPITNAIPNEYKGASMSLMHSFYAWGQVCTIILTTLFIFIFGGKNWQIIVLFWALIPFTNFFMFLKAPFPENVPEEHRLNMRDLLFKPFYILALFAIFAGAGTEVIMNQWASTFMEKALSLPKITGDLAGMCSFAVMLGVGRVIYGFWGGKINLNKVLICSSVLGIICYLTVALSPVNIINLIFCALAGLGSSLLWPGTLVITADKYPLAGAWIFAVLAAAGDIGASFGPYITGLVIDNAESLSFLAGFTKAYGITAEQGSIRIGLLFAVIFPIIALICHTILHKKKNVL